MEVTKQYTKRNLGFKRLGFEVIKIIIYVLFKPVSNQTHNLTRQTLTV